MNNKKQIFTAIIAVLISVGLVATAVYATTTVGNNVDVGGTLDVTATTTLDSALIVAGATTLSDDVTLASGKDLTLQGIGVLTVGAGNATVGSRTSGSGVDLGTFEEGLLVAVQYEDAGVLANTTDGVGTAGIFNLHLNRAITLASGGGYGWAGIWANVEVDKAINQTGGTSAGWFTIWADASGADAAITGSSRLQGLDVAIVTGADFNATSTTKLYGIRIDSSVNANATIDGEFAGINIEAAGTKYDWKVGVDINDSTTGIDIGNATTGIAFTGTVTNVLEFASSDGSQGATSTANFYAITSPTTSDALIKIDIAGTPYWIPAFDAASVTNE